MLHCATVSEHFNTLHVVVLYSNLHVNILILFLFTKFMLSWVANQMLNGSNINQSITISKGHLDVSDIKRS